MIRLLLVAFFFEVGLGLLLVPWSTYWDRNYFVDAIPAMQAAVTNNFVRGAVSGLGLVNMAAGLVELFSLFSAQRGRDEIVTIGRTSAD